MRVDVIVLRDKSRAIPIWMHVFLSFYLVLSARTTWWQAQSTQFRKNRFSRYRICLKLFLIVVISVTAHLGGSLSGVNS